MARNFHPGMGQAVAERTILRKNKGQWETWDDVAHRVALGNSLLCRTEEEQKQEYDILYKHLSKASILMSGRHLQHGDETQPSRNMEVYTNCATSCTSFTLFYLLMNGCFRSDTLVKMANGELRPIELIKPGELVMSFDEISNKFTTNAVLKTHKNNPKPMVRITLASKKEIICTEDHKFRTKDGRWVMAKDIEGEDLVNEE